MDSGLGHADDATLYLEIKFKGFSGEGELVSRKASSLGLVRIDFELDCDGPCVFTMYEVSILSFSPCMRYYIVCCVFFYPNLLDFSMARIGDPALRDFPFGGKSRVLQ